MNVFPQDLGSRWHAELVRTRTANRLRQGGRHPLLAGVVGAMGESAPPAAPSNKPQNWLGRFWTGGADVDDEARSDGLAAMSARTTPLKFVAASGTAMCVGLGLLSARQGDISGGMVAATAMTAWFAGLGLLVPRVLFGRAHKTPLQAREVEALLPRVRDELERAYLTLVLDTMTLSPETIPGEAQEQVRAALRALGRALEELPLLAGGVTGANLADADALRREAALVSAEAQNEPDAVTAASLARQADALLRRADSLSRSATLVRRAHALRREMTAQTEALRAGLSGFHAGATDIAGLSDLAVAVQNVAGEAGQIVRARAELDQEDTVAAATVAALVVYDAPVEQERLAQRVGTGRGAL